MAELWLDYLKQTYLGKGVTYVTPDQYIYLRENEADEPNVTYYIVNEVPEQNISPKFSMTFDGTDFRELITIEQVDRPLASDTKNLMISGDRVDGATFLRSKREALYITVKYNYQTKNLSALRRILGRLMVNEYLAELSFSDEPNIVYYAKIDGLPEVEETYRLGKGELTFVVPDGVGYSREPVEIYKSDTDTNNSIILNNKGSDYAYPIIDLTTRGKTYMVAVTTKDATFQYGQALDASPLKEVKYKITEEPGWEPETYRAVLLDEKFNKPLPVDWTYWDASNIRSDWISHGTFAPMSEPAKKGIVNGKITVSKNATVWENGVRMANWVKGNTYICDGVKDVNKSRSKKAYRLKDKGGYLGWLLEQDIADQPGNLLGGYNPIYGELGQYKWYGPAIDRNIQGKATDFQLDFRCSYKVGKHAEYGALYVGAFESLTHIVGVNIAANKSNRTAIIYPQILGRGMQFNQDLGGYFMKDFKGLITISKVGSRFTFEFRNEITNKMISQAYTVPEAENYTLSKVAIGCMRYSTFPMLSLNTPEQLKVTGFNAQVYVDPNATSTKNIPNPQYVFEPGDQITIDMKTGKAKINGIERLDPIIWGSKPIKIPPGLTEMVVNSDTEGIMPDINVYYRERWK